MENDNRHNFKRKTIIFKHATTAVIISATLFTSLSSMVYAITSPATYHTYKNYIYLVHKNKTTNFLAAQPEKRKGYKIEDRLHILSSLTGQNIKSIKKRIQSNQSILETAEEFGVLDEFNALVTGSYNIALNELYSNGKLSEDEYNSIYNNADLDFITTCSTTPSSKKSMNFKDLKHSALLLANITEKTESEINEMIASGQDPFEILKGYGKLTEYKELILENTLADIDRMLKNGKITEQDADDMIADFENLFLAKN